jgi:hypothetical protein
MIGQGMNLANHPICFVFPIFIIIFVSSIPRTPLTQAQLAGLFLR